MRTLLAFLLCVPVLAGGPPKDKVSHFVGGVGIGFTAGICFKWSGGSAKQSARIGFLVGGASGLAKEYGDKTYGGGRMDPGDALATVAGAALGSWAAYRITKDR